MIERNHPSWRTAPVSALLDDAGYEARRADPADRRRMGGGGLALRWRPVEADLVAILRDHRRWLAGDGGARADLSWSNLSGMILTDLDLRRADLTAADLRGTDLRGADLAGATLDRAMTRDAILAERPKRRAPSGLVRPMARAELLRAWPDGAAPLTEAGAARLAEKGWTIGETILAAGFKAGILVNCRWVESARTFSYAVGWRDVCLAVLWDKDGPRVGSAADVASWALTRLPARLTPDERAGFEAIAAEARDWERLDPPEAQVRRRPRKAAMAEPLLPLLELADA